MTLKPPAPADAAFVPPPKKPAKAKRAYTRQQKGAFAQRKYPPHVRVRAHQIFVENDRQIAVGEIQGVLLREGFGLVPTNTLRNWNEEDHWATLTVPLPKLSHLDGPLTGIGQQSIDDVSLVIASLVNVRKTADALAARLAEQLPNIEFKTARDVERVTRSLIDLETLEMSLGRGVAELKRLHLETAFSQARPVDGEILPPEKAPVVDAPEDRSLRTALEFFEETQNA